MSAFHGDFCKHLHVTSGCVTVFFTYFYFLFVMNLTFCMILSWLCNATCSPWQLRFLYATNCGTV